MRTTTNNLMSIISSKSARVENVILRYSSNEPDTEEMESSKFIESLEYLNKSGIFSDAVDWKYDIICTPEETYVMVYSYLGAAYTICKVEFNLRVCESVEIHDLEKMLKETIFSQLSA